MIFSGSAVTLMRLMEVKKMSNLYVKFDELKEVRNLVLDILYISVRENRLDSEELVAVATPLFKLTDGVVGDIEIFKQVRDKLEEGRKEI